MEFAAEKYLSPSGALLTVFLVSLALRIRYPLGEELIQACSSAYLPL